MSIIRKNYLKINDSWYFVPTAGEISELVDKLKLNPLTSYPHFCLPFTSLPLELLTPVDVSEIRIPSNWDMTEINDIQTYSDDYGFEISGYTHEDSLYELQVPWARFSFKDDIFRLRIVDVDTVCEQVHVEIVNY